MGENIDRLKAETLLGLRIMMNERRRYARYPVPDDFLVFSHEAAVIGWIKDISRGGLSYEYIPTAIMNISRDRIDIFAHNQKRFFLPGLSCKRIYDRDGLEGPEGSPSVKFRHCGVQCYNLTTEQKTRLDFLLNNHCIHKIYRY